MGLKISVILVDDHPTVLKGMRVCIEEEEGLEVSAVACTASELLGLPQLETCDVIVLDVNLPDTTGIEAIPMILERRADARILMFSMHRGVEYVRRALDSGALGYVLKAAMPDELVAAIRAVRHDGTYLPRDIAVALAQGRQVQSLGEGGPQLTGRELEVLRQIAAGEPSKRIAWKLGVSIRTVDAHRRNLKRKLGARSASECVSLAIRAGLIAAL